MYFIFSLKPESAYFFVELAYFVIFRVCYIHKNIDVIIINYGETLYDLVWPQKQSLLEDIPATCCFPDL